MGINQLLEIMHHEKQPEDSITMAAVATELATTENPGRVKRKRIAVAPKRLDHQCSYQEKINGVIKEKSRSQFLDTVDSMFSQVLVLDNNGCFLKML